jgi:hypothetical protein
VVRAPEEGEIYRLKVEWRGYGRALYLRHPDGRISVYAHLERYDDESLGLERRVAEARRSRGTRYPGDIFLEPPVRVRRGARLGFTGESGAGLPHLHFEIRRTDQEPTDPLPALDLTPGALPPVVGSVSLTALEAGGWIDGERTRRYPLRETGDGIYAPSETVRVSGRFRATAEIHSEDREGHRLGIRGLSVAIDSAMIYRFRLDTFRFSDYPAVGVVLDHARSRLSPPDYDYFLDRLPGNTLGVAGEEAPWPRLEEGPHQMEIVAEGALGGVSRARIPFRVVPRRELSLEPAGDEPGRWRIRLERKPEESPGEIRYASIPGRDPLECRDREVGSDSEICRLDPPTGAVGLQAEARREGQLVARALAPFASASPSTPNLQGLLVTPGPGWVDFRISPDRSPFLPSRLVARNDAGGEQSVVFQPEEGSRLRAALPLEIWRGAVGLSLEWRCPGKDCRATIPLSPRTARPQEALVLTDCPARVEIPAGGVFAESPVICRSAPAVVAPPAGMVRLGEAAALSPEGLPFARRARITFPIPPDEKRPGKLAIYREDSASGTWRFLGGEIDSDRVALSIGRLETLALIRDESPPRILGVEPDGGAAVTGRRPTIRVRVADEGTGLNFDGVTIEIDGEAAEPEFDPDRGWATARPERDLPLGMRSGRAWAVDRAGNRSPVVTFAWRVR